MIEVLEFIDFDNFVVRVPSSSIKGKTYLVKRMLGEDKCDCDGFKYYGYCRHFSELFKDPILKPLRNKVDELLGKKPITVTEVDVEGWKGKDDPYIIVSGDMFIIVEHRKRKRDGEIVQGRSKTSKDNVLWLWRLLNNMREKYDKNEFRAKEIWREMIVALSLPIPLDDPGRIYGGKHRTPHYFKRYFRPMKVLEWHYFAVEHNDKTTKLIKLRLPEEGKNELYQRSDNLV